MDRHPEYQYLDLLDILLRRPLRPDRTGTGTRGLFGHQMRFNLAGGRLPLLTTKMLPFKSIAAELLWFLSGDTNAGALQEQGVTIWDEWADVNGDLGPIYGQQWRSWRFDTNEGFTDYIDQIDNVVKSLRDNPYDRGHIVSAWNPADLDKMALRPCHCLFQFYVDDGRLSCQLYQRSADAFLGLPFNIASYSLLTMMMAKVVGLEPGEFVWTGGDVHLYANHVDQARLQLTRSPVTFPRVTLADRDSIDGWQLSDITLGGYFPQKAIPAPVSV